MVLYNNKNFPSAPFILLAIVVHVLVLNQNCVNGDTGIPTFTVHIVNELPNNESLTIHCYSKDDDLGWHNFGVGGEFHWSFRLNIFRRTLFACDVQWIQGRVHFNAFYVKEKFEKKCGFKDCSWRARGDGIYFYNVRAKSFDLIFKWTN